MTTITIESAQLTAALTKLGNALGDLTPILHAVSEDVLFAVEENFETEGARLGKAWKRSQRAIKQSGKTLQDTGRLIASITGTGNSSSVRQVTPNSLFVGTNVEYAAIHQFGGKAGRNRKVTIPPRPFLGLNATDEAKIVKTITTMLGGK